jgi:hypothetical protein
METNIKTTPVYSVFSGTIYDVLESDIKLLDVGQVPLIKNPPRNCKKCYGRYNTGRDHQNYSFSPCSCLRKVVNVDIVRSLENFRT